MFLMSSSQQVFRAHLNCEWEAESARIPVSFLFALIRVFGSSFNIYFVNQGGEELVRNLSLGNNFLHANKQFTKKAKLVIGQRQQENTVKISRFFEDFLCYRFIYVHLSALI